MAVQQTARKMPYSLEAEQAVLGCALISNNVAGEICSLLKDDDFYSLAHKSIYASMYKLNLGNEPIDYVTLVSLLEKENKLGEVGGIEYITSLTNIVSSAANYMHYCDIVLNDSKLRQLIDSSQKIIDEAYAGKSFDEVIKLAEKSIFDIGEDRNKGNLEHISRAVNETTEKFETICKDKDALRGIPSGFYGLDKLTNGLQKGDLILLAARPGVGKTSLGMNIITNAALKNKAHCAVFSLEMPKVQLAQRCLCSTANVDMSKALKGDLSANDWRAIWQAKSKYDNSEIYVDDSSLIVPSDILSKCRKLKREKGLDLVMIDYLQLMSSGGKNENRQQEISEITRFLKIAAKELDVPIILLSQLSRAVESRTDKRPILSDLRESGAIEQDADIVMFIYNPDIYLTDGSLKPGIVDLIVAKHRNGALDTIKLKFVRENVTFKDLNKDSELKSLENSAPVTKVDDVVNDDLPEITPLGESNVTDIF